MPIPARARREGWISSDPATPSAASSAGQVQLLGHPTTLSPRATQHSRQQHQPDKGPFGGPSSLCCMILLRLARTAPSCKRPSTPPSGGVVVLGYHPPVSSSVSSGTLAPSVSAALGAFSWLGSVLQSHRGPRLLLPPSSGRTALGSQACTAGGLFFGRHSCCAWLITSSSRASRGLKAWPGARSP